MTTEPGKQLHEEPQSERGPEGSRDAGPDQAGAGQTDREPGSLDQEEVRSTTEAGTNPAAAAGSSTPGDAEPAIPPYEGRTTSTKDGRPEHDEHVDSGGMQSPKPEETPRGAVASPAEENPAAGGASTGDSDSGVGPSHEGGVGKAEDKR
ncbi:MULTISPECIES: hypothetical protein [unclassified Rhodococcus (in: high G+C Gram-positive bacteria)]|uniref:hypothetical protein n=1 Tax=unclassified Rhodococcus (in: high G+C Gram-positive bacteria) TaxID=192944 RepID=UPI00163AE446|nr:MULTISPECIES: hypothetical protein [unclassified Rhodococcus (in: high G+C Gram-positive bacteria)]MBC2641029.1 hypothetical protein [Rhodococcus sp. 3A]MBC2894226.1 hypothetical protein [Rhodococcus sp. 4CII]